LKEQKKTAEGSAVLTDLSVYQELRKILSTAEALENQK